MTSGIGIPKAMEQGKTDSVIHHFLSNYAEGPPGHLLNPQTETAIWQTSFQNSGLIGQIC
jgi:hypothetical protein